MHALNILTTHDAPPPPHHAIYTERICICGRRRRRPTPHTGLRASAAGGGGGGGPGGSCLPGAAWPPGTRKEGHPPTHPYHPPPRGENFLGTVNRVQCSTVPAALLWPLCGFVAAVRGAAPRTPFLSPLFLTLGVSQRAARSPHVAAGRRGAHGACVRFFFVWRGALTLPAWRYSLPPAWHSSRLF